MKMKWPLLHLYIEIPFVSIRTAIMKPIYDRNTYEYIKLEIQVWKWKWDFALYDTARRKQQRAVRKEMLKHEKERSKKDEEWMKPKKDEEWMGWGTKKYNKTLDGDFRCDACDCQSDCDEIFGPHGLYCPLPPKRIFSFEIPKEK